MSTRKAQIQALASLATVPYLPMMAGVPVTADLFDYIRARDRASLFARPRHVSPRPLQQWLRGSRQMLTSTATGLFRRFRRVFLKEMADATLSAVEDIDIHDHHVDNYRSLIKRQAVSLGLVPTSARRGHPSCPLAPPNFGSVMDQSRLSVGSNRTHLRKQFATAWRSRSRSRAKTWSERRYHEIRTKAHNENPNFRSSWTKSWPGLGNPHIGEADAVVLTSIKELSWPNFTI